MSNWPPATVLLTWELGQGFGHVARLLPLGRELAARGHRVAAAVKDVALAQRVFAGSGIVCIPAPLPRPCPPRFEPTRGWAHVLGNVGFADPSVLEESFLRWNSLFDEVRPSLLVADHSPRALLAVRGRPIRRVNVGTGFFCPPPGFPLPVWAPGNTPGEYSAIVRDEEIILQNVNGLLMSRYRRPLESLSDLFNDLDGVFLTTYPELDHFGPRPRIRYWGHWSLDEGEAPQWPQGDGPKVFAYLKPFPALPMLLRELAKRGGATIVVAPELGDETRREFASPNIQFERRPVDIRRVAHECDIAILNGNHGTTASMLRAGKACLLIPMFTEQAILANRVAALGAGCAASGVVPDEIVSGFDRMCTAGAFWDGADCFRSRHAQLGHDLPVAEIVNLISDVD